jgi:hypothetical protein
MCFNITSFTNQTYAHLQEPPDVRDAAFRSTLDLLVPPVYRQFVMLR